MFAIKTIEASMSKKDETGPGHHNNYNKNNLCVMQNLDILLTNSTATLVKYFHLTLVTATLVRYLHLTLVTAHCKTRFTKEGMRINSVHQLKLPIISKRS